MCDNNSESKRVPEKKAIFFELIYYPQLIEKKSDYKSVSLRLTECILLYNVVFLSIHVIKVAGFSPFDH